MKSLPSNRKLRYALIADLANRLSGISPQFGKTVLMKLLYLLQDVYNLPLNYRFSFYTYGPYTPDVLSDLARVNLLGGTDTTFVDDEPGGYLITPGSKYNQVIEAGQTEMDSYSKEIDHLVDRFGHLRAKDLELRTTIVYVRKHSFPKSEAQTDKLVGVVKQLKPHFKETEITVATEGLKQAKIID